MSSHDAPGHWVLRLTSGPMWPGLSEWQVPLREPLADSRGQGSQATSPPGPSLAFFARGPLWPACRLEAWLQASPAEPLLDWAPSPPSARASPDAPLRPLRTATCPDAGVVRFLCHCSALPFSMAVPTHDWVLGGGAPLTILLVESGQGQTTRFCRTQSQHLRSQVAAALTAPASILQKPVGTSQGAWWTLISLQWARGCRDPCPRSLSPRRQPPERATGQEWSPVVPTWGFCRTQQGPRKAPGGWISLSCGSSHSESLCNVHPSHHVVKVNLTERLKKKTVCLRNGCPVPACALLLWAGMGWGPCRPECRLPAGHASTTRTRPTDNGDVKE